MKLERVPISRLRLREEIRDRHVGRGVAGLDDVARYAADRVGCEASPTTSRARRRRPRPHAAAPDSARPSACRSEYRDSSRTTRPLSTIMNWNGQEMTPSTLCASSQRVCTDFACRRNVKKLRKIFL